VFCISVKGNSSVHFDLFMLYVARMLKVWAPLI